MVWKDFIIPIIDDLKIPKTPYEWRYSGCKVGVLQRFLQDVQDLLAPYLSLKMTALDESVHLGTESTDNDMIGIRQRLKQCPLYLEDTVQDEQSAELISMLRWELERYSGIVLKTGIPADHSALIRVIHSEEYFTVNGGHDVYKDAPTNCAVQHITVEDFRLSGMNQRMTKEKEDPSLRKIIQELAIKLDVYQGCIGCYDWPALDFSVPVTFVTAHKDFEDKGKPIRYVRLRVTPEGKLHFDTWEELFSEVDLEQGKISAAFENSNGTFDYTVKGSVYEDMDNIHVIRDTDQYTLPNMEELKQKLSATRDDELLSVDAIAKAIQGRMDEFSDADRDRCQKILDAMQVYGVRASRRELRRILHLQSKLGKELNELIGKETGIWLSGRLKQKENRELIFGGTLDIRHFCAGNTQYYYSGYCGKSLKYSLPHACRIRKVTSMGEKLQFERYLPLLEVDFVRANGWTVIPFPFKYLREWKRLQ